MEARSLSKGLPGKLPEVTLPCQVASFMPDSLQSYGPQPARLLCPWDSPDENNGVGSHALLQGIFLTQGSNLCLLCLLHWQMDFLPLVPPGKFPDSWWDALFPLAIRGVLMKNSGKHCFKLYIGHPVLSSLIS